MRNNKFASADPKNMDEIFFSSGTMLYCPPIGASAYAQRLLKFVLMF